MAGAWATKTIKIMHQVFFISDSTKVGTGVTFFVVVVVALNSVAETSTYYSLLLQKAKMNLTQKHYRDQR